jgi:Uncharacterised protein family (UPF0259)
MSDVAAQGTFRLADVFSKALTIFGRRFGPFVVLTVMAQVPLYVVAFAMGTPTSGRASAASAVSTGVSTLLNMVCSSIASGAIIYGVVQELRGRVFSIADSIQIAIRRFFPMVGVAICTGILTFLGAILLVVPGIIVACMLYVSMPACIAERAGVFDSMSRSAFLTKGHRWQVFGMFLLILVGSLILGAIAALVFAFTGDVGLRITSQAINAVVGAFYGVIVGVFYYQLRVAKEGVDIDKIASVFD